jgi:hypothetical protein
MAGRPVSGQFDLCACSWRWYSVMQRACVVATKWVAKMRGYADNVRPCICDTRRGARTARSTCAGNWCVQCAVGARLYKRPSLSSVSWMPKDARERNGCPRSVLRRHPGAVGPSETSGQQSKQRVFGVRGTPRALSELRQGEARATRLPGRQSVLHQALRLLCAAALPTVEHPRCGQRTQPGLAHGQRAGQAVHGRAARACC